MLAALLSCAAALSLRAPHLRRTPTAHMCAADSAEIDWREMRARLIASQGFESPTRDESKQGYIYESPLIEQGTILLGGTEMEFGFALRQQFFHKCVLLLLQHDAHFTKGIILNRPSAITQDGWRLWCGHGQVAEGGIFIGEEQAMGELEINCLHSLDSPMADRLSTRVIKGVSCTSLEGAKELVAAGEAQRSDFYVCAGYSGWAPGQLQMEVETRDSWFLASADSATLLSELLRQAKQLPPPSTEPPPTADAADAAASELLGTGTWATLMRGIGRESEALNAEGTLADRMLHAWVRAHLLPKPPRPAPATAPVGVEAGTVLCSSVAADTGMPAERCLLRNQFLHKALLLVLQVAEDGTCTACVLNRPTASTMEFRLGGTPRRRVGFTGDRDIGGQLWLYHQGGGDDVDAAVTAGCVPLGQSGIARLAGAQVATMLQSKVVDVSQLLLVSHVVQFSPSELESMVSAGEMRLLPSGDRLTRLWPRVWALGEDCGDVGDGTEVWWLASQGGGSSGGGLGGGAEQVEEAGAGAAVVAAPPCELADEALAEWLQYFAMPSS